jgi:hypothetical protein
MGALSIGFDTIIVGALALPWVLLAIHLFFSNNESSLKSVLDWVTKQNQPAVAGVLLFAMTYSVGSVVSRIAQDFFDDDDMHLRVFDYLWRVGVTESSIRSDVYCDTSELSKAAPKASDSEGSGSTNSSQSEKPASGPDPLCVFAGRWVIRQSDASVSPGWSNELRDLTGDETITVRWINKTEELTGNRFRVKEAAVLLKGTDDTERIRQFHDQIMVLRGAAFNGGLAFALCLFWWCSKFKSPLRWAVLLIYIFPGVVATVNHFSDHANSPPYMEFTLLSVAAAGGCLLWRLAPEKKNAEGDSSAQHAGGEIRFAYVFLALFLSVSAFLGWWATQVLYDQQVIYSYQALAPIPERPAIPSPK